MSDERWDMIAIFLVFSWPVMLLVGLILWTAHVPIWTFFIFYCLTSSIGVGRLAREFWRHGIHNDR